MEILRIGVDLDNTIFDIRETTLKILNRRFRTDYKVEDIKEYWFVLVFLRQLGLTEEEIWNFVKEVYQTKDDPYHVFRESVPFPGAIPVLEEFHRSKYQIYILTSRSSFLKSVIEEQFRAFEINWIADDWSDGGNILIRGEDYWERMKDEEFKLRTITGNFSDGKYKDFPGLDLHLDDMGEIISHPLAEKFGVKDRLFIFAQTWNRHFVPKENLVPNWWVFNEVVRYRAQGKRFDLPNLVSHNV